MTTTKAKLKKVQSFMDMIHNNYFSPKLVDNGMYASQEDTGLTKEQLKALKACDSASIRVCGRSEALKTFTNANGDTIEYKAFIEIMTHDKGQRTGKAITFTMPIPITLEVHLSTSNNLTNNRTGEMTYLDESIQLSNSSFITQSLKVGDNLHFVFNAHDFTKLGTSINIDLKVYRKSFKHKGFSANVRNWFYASGRHVPFGFMLQACDDNCKPLKEVEEYDMESWSNS
jgi:hypothetical protein